MRVAIMAVDPGGKTGMAWGVFNDEAESVGAAMRRGLMRGHVGSMELCGSPAFQSHVIVGMWKRFVSKKGRDYLVFEDFQLRQRSADLAPVRVISGVQALLSEEKTDHEIAEKTDHSVGVDVLRPGLDGGLFWPWGEIEFQGPSQAMTFATNDRLCEWGAWVVGSEHRRDAMRHLCTKLSDLLS